MFHLYRLIIWAGTLAGVPHVPHTHIPVSSMSGTLSTPLATNLPPLHNPLAWLQCTTQLKCWNVTTVSLFLRPPQLWPLQCPPKFCLLKSLPKFPCWNVHQIWKSQYPTPLWMSTCPHQFGMLSCTTPWCLFPVHHSSDCQNVHTWECWRQPDNTKTFVNNKFIPKFFVLLFYRCRFLPTHKDIAVPLLSPANRPTIMELPWIYPVTSPIRSALSVIFVLFPLTIFSFLYFMAQPDTVAEDTNYEYRLDVDAPTDAVIMFDTMHDLFVIRK